VKAAACHEIVAIFQRKSACWTAAQSREASKRLAITQTIRGASVPPTPLTALIVRGFSPVRLSRLHVTFELLYELITNQPRDSRRWSGNLARDYSAAAVRTPTSAASSNSSPPISETLTRATYALIVRVFYFPNKYPKKTVSVSALSTISALDYFLQHAAVQNQIAR
jgi:hypothetical protein